LPVTRGHYFSLASFSSTPHLAGVNKQIFSWSVFLCHVFYFSAEL
jgi:hypothetical protein